MAIVLALLCSTAYGAGDFFGGFAAKKVHPFAVGWIAHSLVVLPLTVAAVLVGASEIRSHDLLWGAIGGLLGAAALLALYAGLARGPMSIVSPTAALVSAAIPVVVGALQGERPKPLQWFGIALALVAIVFISVTPPTTSAAGAAANRPSPFDPVTFALSIGAGFGFGGFFVALAKTSKSAGLWPLVSGRVASATTFWLLIVLVISIRKRALAIDLGDSIVPIGLSALFDVTANGFYLFASRLGLLSIVAVLASLYPASTIVLARRVLNERIAPSQLGGLALATAAVILVAVN
jgi:drug/metabolite transporter (DMT)-like permease